jgi:hypothetical protein
MASLLTCGLYTMKQDGGQIVITDEPAQNCRKSRMASHYMFPAVNPDASVRAWRPTMVM